MVLVLPHERRSLFPSFSSRLLVLFSQVESPTSIESYYSFQVADKISRLTCYFTIVRIYLTSFANIYGLLQFLGAKLHWSFSSFSIPQRWIMAWCGLIALYKMFGTKVWPKRLSSWAVFLLCQARALVLRLYDSLCKSRKLFSSQRVSRSLPSN